MPDTNSSICEPTQLFGPKSLSSGLIKCSTSFRTFDGSCTSSENPGFGTAGTAQFSIVPDSSSLVPNGQNRPSARRVSNVVADQGDVDMPNSRGLTLFFVFFGQLLDHDFVLTPVNTSEPFPIPVPVGDSIFGNATSSSRRRRRRCRGRNCRKRRISVSFGSSSIDSGAELPFSRSVRVMTSPTDPTQQRPINANTSPIDLSEVYGSDEERFEALIEPGSCKLRTSGDGTLLPLNVDNLENEPVESADFFVAGDIRSNENPALTSLHTIFLREHNLLCDELESDFPELSQRELFDLARKVNIFQKQRIVYEEFLPAILGRQIEIGPFDPSIDLSVSDIFSTAAFRLGHTMVGNTLPTGLRSIPELTAVNFFFRTAAQFRNIGSPGLFLNAIARTIAQEVDVKVVDTLRNFLFSAIEEVEGLDLIALNLQRGRDHALPSYNTVRNFFGLPTITSFQDVTSDIALQFRLRLTYERVDDIDLWIALLAEDHVRGASVGETMFAVWEWEFRRIAEGDRFFYLSPTLFDEDFKRRFSRFARILRTKSLMRAILLRNTKGIRFPKSLFRNEKGRPTRRRRY